MATRNSFLQELRRSARVVVTEERIITGRASADDSEYWHVVGNGGEVGFVNGWGHFGPSNQVRFRMDRSGFVHLQGVARATPSTSGHIFTLPLSWAPNYLHQFVVLRSGLAIGEVLGLYIHEDGRVELPFGGVGSYDVYLDNYRWRGKL
jgi:hypothetical protein